MVSDTDNSRNGAATLEGKATNGGGATAGEIAAQYKARGWKPIPVPYGEKGPRGTSWQNRSYDPARDFDGKSIGVQLGPVSGGLTD